MEIPCTGRKTGTDIYKRHLHFTEYQTIYTNKRLRTYQTKKLKGSYICKKKHFIIALLLETYFVYI